jgi:hypothetical protein
MDVDITYEASARMVKFLLEIYLDRAWQSGSFHQIGYLTVVRSEASYSQTEMSAELKKAVSM